MQGEVWRGALTVPSERCRRPRLEILPQLIRHDHRATRGHFCLIQCLKLQYHGPWTWRQFGCDGMSGTCVTLLTSHTRVHLRPRRASEGSTGPARATARGRAIAHKRSRDFLMSFEPKAPNFLSQ